MMADDRGVFLENGQLFITGYPEGCFILSFDNEKTRRMRRLRYAQKILGEAKCALERLGKEVPVNDHLLREYLISGISGAYFSCFAQGGLSPRLSAREVYKGEPEAFKRHSEWRDFRDKRFHHPEEMGRTFATGIVLDHDGKFVELETFSFDIGIGQLHGYLNILFELICHALSFVERRVDDLFDSIRNDAEKLEPEDFAKLRPLQVHSPEYR